MLILLFLMVQAVVGETIIHPSQFQTAVERSFAMQRPANEGARRTLEFRSLPKPLTVTGRNIRLCVDEPLLPDVRGNMSVAVSVYSNELLVQKILVSLKVRTFGTVAIAARQLEQHAVLQPGDMMFQERETTATADAVVTVAAETEGRRTKRIIAAGSLLRRDALERMPAVQQNGIIVLVVRSGAVRLSVKAIAKADGVIGQMIQVQREGSHDRLYARVVADGLVEAVSERIVR